jgi:hypothetical protein
MFRFFKSKQRKVAEAAIDLILIPTIAIDRWKHCCSETDVYTHGPSIYPGGYRNVTRWRHIMHLFYDEWRGIHPLELDPGNRLKKVCEMYLHFIESKLMPKIQAGKFTDAECDKIGEFLAICISRGLNEALVNDPERSALIYDSIPPDWLATAKFERSKFDLWYTEKTGKHRVPRS